MKKQILNLRNWQYFLFWSWNIIFMAFTLIGFAPTVLPEMITSVRAGVIPGQYLLFGLILALIPLSAIILGATLLRKEPGKLFQLGYGVEGPLMLLLAVRFFVIRDSTPVVTLLFGIGALGMGTLLWSLLDGRINQRGPFLTHLRVIGLTLLLIIGIFASIWIAFYAVPIAALILQLVGEILGDLGQFIREIVDVLRDGFRQAIIWVPFMILGLIQLAYTATLFVIMPIAVPLIYGRAWLQSLRALSRRYSEPRAVALSTAVIALLIFGIIQTNQQPQHKAFALLEEPPATPEEADALLSQQDLIRAGLLNAYLAQHRYISAQGEVNHISDLYEEAFKISPTQGAQVQGWYERLLSPLLYHPVHEYESLNRWDNRTLREEPAKAAALYEQFFDEPITEGEKETVVRAVRSTWMPDQARAGWQAVDDREIYLAQQEVTVLENGDWADVELYEVYENQTTQRQEVVYYFTLPETAVLTGLWLGNSPNRETRFDFRVAPRGAAQAVYRQEVQRRVDPALLEQIGPSQYRLRAFPVPPMSRDWEDELDHTVLAPGQPLHMWLTYQVMSEDNSWPLPYLAEQFNVYWDRNTSRLLNGQPMDVHPRVWLPETAPTIASSPPTGHRVDFPDGTAVIAQPVNAENLPQPNGDLALAVVLDRSRSMAVYDETVQEALAQVGEWGTAVDVYLTASEFRGEEAQIIPLAQLDSENILYYGGQNAGDLLLQFSDLYAGQEYDAILVLTDGTGFGVSYDGREATTPNVPLWMIHMDGTFPLGYDDATLEAIQASGGGSAAAVNEALTRLAFTTQNQVESVTSDVADGYIWTRMPTETADTLSVALEKHEPADDFAAFAGRRQILAEMQTRQGDLSDLETLDALHAIAIEHGIVTPYSSMIVLVETRQEKMLDELENDADRFEREFEEVGETDQQLTVTGVPEPEEWLLIGLANLMLIAFIYKTCQSQINKSVKYLSQNLFWRQL
ncbi:MAG: TIGR02921 family PEP-CTERM protein [Chloroflexi bacterium]|nr:TIGR02921 family PEP-CTERM protein [Chloroflexota bacterium]